MAGRFNRDGEPTVEQPHVGKPVERRLVYGGARESTQGYTIRPNKRGIHRRRSTFKIVVALFCAGAAIVVYINNIITVNRLAAEVDTLKGRLNKITNTNAVLMAEINGKSGWERIGKLASEQGLRHAREHPAYFDIDTDMASRVEKTP
jgi:hypothetical protein